MYFPYSYAVIWRVDSEYMERTFFKQRQQGIISSSITVMNILLNCWWLLFHRNATPTLLVCSWVLQQIKSYSGLFHFSKGQETRAEPASSVRFLLQGDGGAAGGDRFLPDKAEDKYLSHPTCSHLIEMTHHYIFLSYMTLTITAHYPWPVLNTVQSA